MGARPECSEGSGSSNFNIYYYYKFNLIINYFGPPVAKPQVPSNNEFSINGACNLPRDQSLNLIIKGAQICGIPASRLQDILTYLRQWY
jgi:hypothetical protein